MKYLKILLLLAVSGQSVISIFSASLTSSFTLKIIVCFAVTDHLK